MRHPFLARTRPLSAGERRELYGLPVAHYQSCEEAFRKQAYRRDHQSLMVVVGAIDHQKKQAQRKWDLTKSRFARQHAEFVKVHTEKVVYHKVGTVSRRPEEDIPPCIPFLGAFPPTRHPTKERRLSEMYKEPLFSRGTAYDPDNLSNPEDDLEDLGDWGKEGEGANREEGEGEEGEAAGEPSGDYAYYLASHRISNSLKFPDPNAKRPLQRKSLPPQRTEEFSMFKNSTLNGNSKRRASAGPRINPNIKNQPKVSQTPDKTDRPGSTRRFSSRSEGSPVKDNSAPSTKPQSSTAARRWQSKSAGDKRRLPTNPPSSLAANDNRKPPLQQSQNKTSVPDQKPPQSRKNGASHLDSHNEEVLSDDDTPSTSELTARSDTTAESLDVEMLRQALVDHSQQNLAKSRWHRASETSFISHESSVPLHELTTTASHHPERHPPGTAHRGSSSSNPPEEVLPSPRPSLISVATPASRTASDISENLHDTNLQVIQIIMRLFKEVNNPQLTDLEEVWPAKMRKLKAEMEHLVSYTGVDITEIVEKIQRGDIHDDKTAALLNWVQHVDSSPAPRAEHVASQPPSSPGHGPDLEASKLTTTAAPTPGAEDQDEERPVIRVMPPSRKQSCVSGSEDKRRRNSTDTTHSRLSTASCRPRLSRTNSLSSQPQSACTSNDAALLYQLRKNMALNGQGDESDAEGPAEESALSRLKRLSLASSSTIASDQDTAPKKTSMSILPATAASPPAPNSSSNSSLDGEANTSSKKPSNQGELSLCLHSPFFGSVESINAFQATESTVKAEEGIVNCPETGPNARKTAQRRVSFYDVRKMASTPSSLSSNEERETTRHHSKREVPRQDGSCGTQQRAPRAPSFSSSTSSADSQGSPQSKGFRQRVGSAGHQRYPLRKGSAAPVLTRTEQEEGASSSSRRRRSLSATPYWRRGGRGSICTEGSGGSAGGGSPPSDRVLESEERPETTRTVTHTDRAGNKRRLTMRKMSLSYTEREANVIFTRDENAEAASENSEDSSTSVQNDDRKTPKDEEEQQQQKEEEEEEEPGKEKTNTRQSLHDVVHKVVNSQAARKPNKDDKESKNTTTTTTSTTTIETHSRQETNSQSKSTKKNKDGKDRNNKTKRSPPKKQAEHEKDDANEKEKDGQHLWRKRLSHPRGMAWVSELISDDRAQGLALSLLRRKEGADAMFRSTVLSVICINALRAAKSVHDDDAYREMKKCRYLRMPARYVADSQGQLDVQEVFA